MFTNIGGKIKALAKVVAWIGIIGSIIGGIVVMFTRHSAGILALLVILSGSLISWIGSFFTYGFGELIERTCLIEEHLTRRSAARYAFTDGDGVDRE